MSNFFRPQYICIHSGQPFWNGLEYYATSARFKSHIAGLFIWNDEIVNDDIAFFHSREHAESWKRIKFDGSTKEIEENKSIDALTEALKSNNLIQ